MQLSPASVSSPKRGGNRSGPRLRKKHKRLDAICEDEYTRNHVESNEGIDGGDVPGSSSPSLELRRSSRVRRPPELLDVSSSPTKKRRMMGRNSSFGVDNKRGSSLRSVKEESEPELLTSGTWKTRLRSRRRNVKSGDMVDLSRRRKLFGEMDEKASESGVGMEEGIKEEDLVLVNKKSPERLEEANALGDEAEVSGEEEEMHETEDEVEIGGVEEQCETGEELEVVRNEAEDVTTILERVIGGENEAEIVDNDAKVMLEEEEREVLSSKELEEDCIADENVCIETVDQSIKEGEQLKGGDRGENQQDGGEDGGNSTNEVKDGPFDDQKDGFLVRPEEKPMEGENAVEVDELNHGPKDKLNRPRIKQGRRCGLCGCGNDGKPPRRLIQAVGESENEAYSGSSASEEPNYDIWDGFGDEPGWLGRLLGPINDRYGIAGIWVHQHCAVWSPEVYFAGLGCLKNVRAALCRGRALKCSRCGRPGATIGCRVDRCPRTYHLPCARANGCIFDHRKFLIACTDHRHFFQPYGNQYLVRIKKLKARKMKLETRKLSNDACRKDIEAEEKWLENCGEDEEFLKRESKRLHRDLLRIAPVYIGGADSEGGKLFEGWESVAGLQDVIRCMKEVVILPLLYPEFFDNMGLTPPRGVLLHGYPGTGKTLVVRALIGSCARGERRIAYFARKGADCLGKYVGDAERQLRLLFQVAEKCQPSVIFFDEIDGLAPRRTRQQDQTHSSVVSTLLALLDGLKSRGSVVVIGATNRPEAIDPALRRPGRFDREIYFPLPSMEDRAAILSLHTQRWPKPVGGSLLNWIASRTASFAGADLQALCTQAAMIALKRNFPLQEVLSSAGDKVSGGKRVPLPSFVVEERDWLEALSCSPPPCSRREAGIAAYDLVTSPLPTHLIPCLLQPLSTLLVSLYLDERLWLPPPLTKAAMMIKSLIVSALDKKKFPSDNWWLHVDDFLQDSDVAKEIERRLSHAGIITGEASFADSDASAVDAVDAVDDHATSILYSNGRHTSLWRNTTFASDKKSGFRLLISGDPRSGQRHLAACLLHCFVGNIEIQKVDLATISQEGHDDMVQGLTRILMKCSSAGSCVVFMPRIDLWAVETLQHETENSDSSPSSHPLTKSNESCLTHGQVIGKEIDSCLEQHKSVETKEFQVPSHAWSSFVEQVESICVSTSLMILATSEVPYPLLPQRVRQFFESRTSNCSHLIPLEHTVPRFSVLLGGNFNRDVVINLSAAELSRDLIQPVVQLIQQRNHHRTNSCKDPKTNGFFDICTDTEHHSRDHASATGHEGRAQPPDDSFVKVPPPNNRTLKGRSSLLLAISTFGYQILRYPHFAELCWVTSKLKEGPCADVSGPWKGWPFNSCIIRPSDSVEKVAVACDSSNIKSKEKSGLVRGLIAVGLIAYREVYASLREVALDVRRVLELLVGEINAKIQAGKDRYRYVRLLSQVAYLEDVVNSWAHALQSLESDVQMKVLNPKVNVGCLDNTHTDTGNLNRSDACKPTVSNRNSHESSGMEGNPRGFATENVNCISLNNGYCDFDHLDTEGKAGHLEEGSALHIAHPDVSLNKNLEGSTVADQSVDIIINEQNGTNLEPSELERNADLGPSEKERDADRGPSETKSYADLEPRESERTADLAVGDTHSGSMKHSNGFAFTQSIILSENGLSNSGQMLGTKLSDSQNSSDQINGLSEPETKIACNDGKPDSSEHTAAINIPPSKTVSVSADSEIICIYRCCSECLCILHTLMQKIFIHTLELNGCNWTVEDVHDVVASLSADLLPAVRKDYLASSSSSSFDENLTLDNLGKLSGCPGINTCHCKKSGIGLVAPVECNCHTIGERGTEKSTSSNTHFGYDLKFVFRDDVLVPLDSNKDITFHCKYETVCLCSLIKSIVVMKQVV
ncbi:hypothetical protein QYF36_017648 [Acer negundo]|nr:hypothetical protein QYF36_017648 [Acer negundo]